MKHFQTFYRLFEQMVDHRFAYLGCFINRALGKMSREFMDDSFPTTPAEALPAACKAAILQLNGCDTPYDCFTYLWDTFSPEEKLEFETAALQASTYAINNFDAHNLMVIITINFLAEKLFANADPFKQLYNAAVKKASTYPLKDMIEFSILYDTKGITPLSDPRNVKTKPRRLNSRRTLQEYKKIRVAFWKEVEKIKKENK